MTPTRVTVWQCGNCSHLWHDEKRAAMCCQCACGGGPTVYTGSNGRCRLCKAKEDLELAKACQANGDKMVADAEERLRKLEGR